jgi:DNA-directed RNA polymerase subunit L
MSKSIDINIKQIDYIKRHVVSHTISTNDNKKKYTYDVPINSKLILEFSGKDISNEIVNTLRRISMDNIPTYAFTPELIKISDNNTIFDNDMMRKRLAQLPVLDTELDLDYLDPLYWQNIDFTDPKRPKHEKEKLIEISVNVTNDTMENKSITTNDINYYFEGKEEKQKYDVACPILLVQLKPADTFKCTMKAVLGTGERNNIWAAASIAFYDDHSTDDIKGGFNESKKITFTVESQGMMHEHTILSKACRYIIHKLNTLQTEIDNKVKSKEIKESSTIVFDLNNEDHTLGNLINWAFQSHPKIIFSGVSKPDQLIKAVKIKICSDDKSPIPHMFKQLEYLITVFKHIENSINNLTKKK